jgi:asparagine synthase (glutamine-hydrolysing)
MTGGYTVVLGKTFAEFALHGAGPAGSLTSLARMEERCAVLMGRLYYRNELLARLSVANARDAPANDAALALAVYEKRGVQGIAGLEGDYCAAIWDGRLGALFVCRDPMGGFPVYWTNSNGVFVAATSIHALPDTPSQFDLDFIADYLALPFLGSHDDVTEACIYKGVRRVMPGAIISVRLPGLNPRTETAWDWRARISDPGAEDAEKIAGQYEPLIRNAVHERVRGKTAAHFSGGMDSTAVSLIASGRLERTGSPPLHALSLVYNRLASLKGEAAFIDLALAGRKNIVSHRIEADDLLAYDSPAENVPSDEPYAVSLSQAQEQAIAEAAAANGVETILTGCGGDDLFDAAPYHIADMLRGWSWGGAWREAGAWGQALGRDPWTVLKLYGIKPLRLAAWQVGIPSHMRRGKGPGAIAPWILPGFARSHGLYERSLSQLRKLYGGAPSVQLSVLKASIGGWSGDRRRWTLAQKGLMLCHPLLDPRIVSLAMGVCLRRRPRPDEHKPLLARSMRGVLPAEIRNRRGKVNFNEVYYRGLSRNLRRIEALVEASPLAELGVIDRTGFLSCLRQTALGVEASAASGVHMNLTLSLVTWFPLSERLRPRPPSPAEIIRIPLAKQVEGEPC